MSKENNLSHPANHFQTVEGLKGHPVFQCLSKRQQEFVLAYIELKGDRIAAVIKIYNPKRPDQTAMRLLRNAYIRKVLSIFYGYDLDQAPLGKTELCGLIASRLRDKSTKTSDFWHLAAQYTELKERKPRRKLDLVEPDEPGKTDEANADSSKEVPVQPEVVEPEQPTDINALVAKIESERRNKES